MRICLTAVGTHGDVLPFLALARGLRKANHTVRFATTALFKEAVEAADLEFYPVQGNPQGFMSGIGGKALREIARHPKRFQRFWNIYLAPYARTHLRQTWEAAQGFDAVVCLPWYQAAPSLSEKLGIPCYSSTPMPLIGVPTAEMWNPIEHAPARDSGARNRRSWHASTTIVVAPFEQVNRWRVDVLGLRALSTKELLRLYRRGDFLLPYSQTVLPKPKDWPTSIQVVGFWFTEPNHDWQPPAPLARFLEANPRPLLVGFSSAVARDLESFNDKVTKAVIRCGKPAILVTGWGGLRQTDLPSNVLIQESIPYAWIVPRASGFLHHGGCGTMALCLRYGVPNMAIPFGFDQSLWGRRIGELGLGPPPVAPEDIEVNSLAEALVRMTEDAGYQRAAHAMAEKIQREDGVLAAVHAIEEAHAAGRRCHAQ